MRDLVTSVGDWNGMKIVGIFHLFVVVCFSGSAQSGTVITSLPGYDGNLPFTLETGYVGVDESQFFYLFVESQSNPALDPFMLWLSGGPGCSVLSAFFYENGPVSFVYDNYSGGIPQLRLNPNTWTKGMNMLYVDAPVEYQTYLRNKCVAAKKSCGENYVDIAENNTKCIEDLNVIEESICDINVMHILEPNCKIASPRKIKLPNEIRRYLEDDFDVSKLNDAHWCREYHHVLSAVWCNNFTVREALNVRVNTTGVWNRCNSSLAYTNTVPSSVPYHQNLTKSGLSALVYSGDHDLSIPHVGTEKWIKSLNMTCDEHWRPWLVNGQVAGYTEKFTNGSFSFTYATIKDGGHIALEYKPIECYEMIDRWMAYYPL